MMADEKIDQLRNQAYQIWEHKGRPQGRDLEHCLEAERELEANDDRNDRANKEEAGLEAARAYSRDVQEFGRHENVAAEAQHKITCSYAKKAGRVNQARTGSHNLRKK